MKWNGTRRCETWPSLQSRELYWGGTIEPRSEKWQRGVFYLRVSCLRVWKRPVWLEQSLGLGEAWYETSWRCCQRPDHADVVGYGKNFGFPRATWDATQRVWSVSGDMLRLAFWKSHSGFWMENGLEGQALWVRDMATWIKEVMERSWVDVTFCIPGHLLCARPRASCWRYNE